MVLDRMSLRMGGLPFEDGRIETFLREPAFTAKLQQKSFLRWLPAGSPEKLKSLPLGWAMQAEEANLYREISVATRRGR